MEAKNRKRRSRAGRPTGAELERRKGKIVETATKLFVERGYAATSLVDIARKSGVATRTIYQHFGDKGAMFKEVIFSRDNAPSVPPPEMSARDSLFASLMKVAQYSLDVSFNPKTVKLMRLMVSEHDRFADLTRKVANTSYDKFYTNIEKMFVDLCEAGRIPPDDHLETAKLFTDFVLGATPFYNYANWLDKAPSEQQIRTKVEIFIRGRFGAEVAKSAHSSAPARGRGNGARSRTGAAARTTRAGAAQR